jgi:Lysyl oxidase
MQSPRGRVRLALIVLALGATATAIPAVAGSAPTKPGTGLLPDLQTVVPTHLQIVNQQQRDWLRFSNGIANTGQGALALRPEHVGDITNGIQEIRDANGIVVSERLASQYEFHPAHNHWHLGDVALFEVRQGSPTGPVVDNNSIKVTFCLIDWYALEGNSNTKARGFWDCETGYQGISAGWVDQYHHALEGQRLDLTNAPNGTDLYLVSTSNHENTYLESDSSNNTAWTRFRLSQESQGNRKVTVTGNSACSSPSMCGVGVPNR